MRSTVTIINEKNNNFASNRSFILSKEENGLTVHSLLRKMNSLTIPVNLVRVVTRTFMGSEISTVTIQNNLTYLGNEAFCGCKCLQEVTISQNTKLRSLGKRCFAKCRQLSAVDFGNLFYVKSFSEEMLYHTKIMSIRTPKYTKVIDCRCFG